MVLVPHFLSCKIYFLISKILIQRQIDVFPSVPDFRHGGRVIQYCKSRKWHKIITNPWETHQVHYLLEAANNFLCWVCHFLTFFPRHWPFSLGEPLSFGFSWTKCPGLTKLHRGTILTKWQTGLKTINVLFFLMSNQGLIKATSFWSINFFSFFSLFRLSLQPQPPRMGKAPLPWSSSHETQLRRKPLCEKCLNGCSLFMFQAENNPKSTPLYVGGGMGPPPAGFWQHIRWTMFLFLFLFILIYCCIIAFFLIFWESYQRRQFITIPPRRMSPMVMHAVFVRLESCHSQATPPFRAALLECIYVNVVPKLLYENFLLFFFV